MCTIALTKSARSRFQTARRQEQRGVFARTIAAGGCEYPVARSLKHLILRPRSGLCGRLRALSSALRFCEVHEVGQLSIAWDMAQNLYGKNLSGFNWIEEAEIDSLKMSHPCVLMSTDARDHPQRCVNRILSVQTLCVETSYIFPFPGEDYFSIVSASVSFLPPPTEEIQQQITEFAEQYFGKTVGMHMRRTDNAKAIMKSPDRAYFREAHNVISEGKTIFLASDNEEVSRMMKDRFGTHIITFPKSNPNLVKRWPRPKGNVNDLVEDFIDLHLLAACEYVLGSHHSAYSTMAIAMNRSPKCRMVQ